LIGWLIGNHLALVSTSIARREKSRTPRAVAAAADGEHARPGASLLHVAARRYNTRVALGWPPPGIVFAHDHRYP
jgi:hypothetical protein